MLNIKRIYDVPSKEDGYRILVDRLWPRGVSKERAHLYQWAKDITPSSALRYSIHHEGADFSWLKAAYADELNENPETKNFIGEIKKLLSKGNVTFLTASKNPDTSHLAVLKNYLEKRI
ncbi:MAG: DUF488 family protein [Alphaproteobacteria bacterium]|nr:DUF488 family protein [Alphaproteobacteria bacterium]